MKATYTPDQFSKLPKWAQAHINDITRERETAIHALNSYLDCKTPSPFYCEDVICTGEECGPSFKKIYINASVRSVACEHGGIKAELHIANNGGLECIFEPQNHGIGTVAIQPSCSNVIRFVKIAKEPQ